MREVTRYSGRTNISNHAAVETCWFCGSRGHVEVLPLLREVSSVSVIRKSPKDYGILVRSWSRKLEKQLEEKDSSLLKEKISLLFLSLLPLGEEYSTNRPRPSEYLPWRVQKSARFAKPARRFPTRTREEIWAPTDHRSHTLGFAPKYQIWTYTVPCFHSQSQLTTSTSWSACNSATR